MSTLLAGDKQRASDGQRGGIKVTREEKKERERESPTRAKDREGKRVRDNQRN